MSGVGGSEAKLDVSALCIQFKSLSYGSVMLCSVLRHVLPLFCPCHIV